MTDIAFLPLNNVDQQDLLAVLNESALRVHLVEHALFDIASLHDWVEEKNQVDSLPGCRVRGVVIDGIVAGWCGIQPDDNGVELAIVLSKKFWGYGISLFKTLMVWAHELGHKEIRFHLLDSRPEYKALQKMASKVDKTKLMGRCFTTYFLEVGGDSYISSKK